MHVSCHGAHNCPAKELTLLPQATRCISRPCLRSAALREACERSGTPQHLLEGALEQVRLAEHHGASAPEFEVTCVRVYVPPPLADATSRPMLLFREPPTRA
ncbi:hypothetical protein TcBrA4_0122860 [Trypanosoma cruzi]|nr:hypothetical protein TcBrA4_0122860 [Trypanosoma cruzi]